MQGAGLVFGVDPVEGRRDRAARFGATPLEPPALGAVLEATGGRGAASVIDAVASDTTMTEALTCVRPGGTVSVIGVHNLNPFPFPATISLVRSVSMRLTTAPVQRTWPELIPLIQSGRLDTSGIFTDSMALSDAPGGLCQGGVAVGGLHQGDADPMSAAPRQAPLSAAPRHRPH